jgi:hypothetical protein
MHIREIIHELNSPSSIVSVLQNYKNQGGQINAPPNSFRLRGYGPVCLYRDLKHARRSIAMHQSSIRAAA